MGRVQSADKIIKGVRLFPPRDSSVDGVVRIRQYWYHLRLPKDGESGGDRIQDLLGHTQHKAGNVQPLSDHLRVRGQRYRSRQRSKRSLM